MYLAPISPTGLRFNENAAQPDQRVETTGCLWFGVADVFFFSSFFYCTLLLQNFKPSPYQSCFVKALLQTLNCCQSLWCLSVK